jgi:glyoxylase-like metal-dependent hydrolase (beta-lactamase superfamily II)
MGESMKRVLVLGSVIVAGFLAIAVTAQPPPGQRAPPAFPPLSAPEKVAENVYRITGAGGNSAILIRPDGVLLVDTKLANNGPGLLEQIRKVTDKPITHIINTHTHGDHTGSNAFFGATVDFVAQENTKANMQKMPDFKSGVGLPHETFKDHMTLFSGKQAVDLYYFGAAHTNGDAFVVFRSARVMHAGDVFATKGIPIIDPANGGSGVAYPDTIAKAAAAIKNVDRVITGHSDVMSWQDFVDYGEFNRDFLDHARAARAAGESPEQAAASFKPKDKFKGYTLTSFFGGADRNVATIYGELGK